MKLCSSDNHGITAPQTITTNLAVNCSKSTMKTPEQCVKSVEIYVTLKTPEQHH